MRLKIDPAWIYGPPDETEISEEDWNEALRRGESPHEYVRQREIDSKHEQEIERYKESL